METPTSICGWSPDETTSHGCDRVIPRFFVWEPVLPDGWMLLLEMAGMFPNPGSKGDHRGF